MSDQIHQTTFQKLITFITGLGGMSMTFMDVAQRAQQVGMIVGCVLVCGQAYVFFKGRYLNWKRRKPSNDA